MQILLANPRGFCAGVIRAIDVVEQALRIYGKPIYVYHEIVHNNYVIQNLCKQGVIFIENLKEVPDNSVLIFSAHGVSQKIKLEAQTSNFNVIFDATCPLVTKIHNAVLRANITGSEIIVIGHHDHPEIKGTIGQYNNIKNGGIYLIESTEDALKLIVKDANNLRFVTQTTLSVQETSTIIKVLRKRFPKILGPSTNNICFASTNRQEAVRILATKVELILVIGSIHSSNAKSLIQLAQQLTKSAKLIDSVNDIKKDWIKGVNSIGITAGASVPDILVHKVIDYLSKINVNNCTIHELSGKKEKFVFPKESIIKTFNI
ncbi:MAG: 4-hydroxy-3-methylbut-2-enyl diphosphate reductase [Pantoea sp. Brub]|nr:4-hydroxy-3-methylbut-2-enyl diphosphate reductase [Pantoea sp. Brub]